jgi:hypothetical protein
MPTSSRRSKLNTISFWFPIEYRVVQLGGFLRLFISQGDCRPRTSTLARIAIGSRAGDTGRRGARPRPRRSGCMNNDSMAQSLETLSPTLAGAPKLPQPTPVNEVLLVTRYPKAGPGRLQQTKVSFFPSCITDPCSSSRFVVRHRFPPRRKSCSCREPRRLSHSAS